MITITEDLFKKMPDDVKELFNKLPNDGSDEVVDMFPNTKSTPHLHNHKKTPSNIFESFNKDLQVLSNYNDEGSAARFFYSAKASKKERNEGCENLEDKDDKFLSYSRWCVDCNKTYNGSNDHSKCSGKLTDKKSDKNVSKNTHPTVKPIALMRYLVRLVTPKGGLVLDPFTGSGSTLIGAIQEGFDYIGIEKEKEYIKIIKARIKHHTPVKKVQWIKIEPKKIQWEKIQ